MSPNSNSVSGTPAPTAGSVERAIDAFRNGEPVLIHDAADREGETDIVYPAGAVTPDAVARMRNDGGGLLFAALGDDVAAAFDLPYLHEELDHPSAAFEDVGYDARPSFSLTVNHRDTYTGITDEDRALTVSTLAEAAADPEGFDFADTFRAPGHVHLLRAAPELVADREGHTELGVALALAADRPPVVAGCEMLDDDSGGALTPAAAQAYADRHDFVYVEGRDLIPNLS